MTEKTGVKTNGFVFTLHSSHKKLLWLNRYRRLVAPQPEIGVDLGDGLLKCENVHTVLCVVKRHLVFVAVHFHPDPFWVVGELSQRSRTCKQLLLEVQTQEAVCQHWSHIFFLRDRGQSHAHSPGCVVTEVNVPGVCARADTLVAEDGSVWVKPLWDVREIVLLVAVCEAGEVIWQVEPSASSVWVEDDWAWGKYRRLLSSFGICQSGSDMFVNNKI